MYVGILGGPAAVDDISMLPAGGEPQVPPELKANRIKIEPLAVDCAWRSVAGEPVWEQRADIAVSEVMGLNVSGALVNIELQDIFPGRFTYRNMTRRRLMVVDAGAQAGGPLGTGQHERGQRSCGHVSGAVQRHLRGFTSGTLHEDLLRLSCSKEARGKRR